MTNENLTGIERSALRLAKVSMFFVWLSVIGFGLAIILFLVVAVAFIIN